MIRKKYIVMFLVLVAFAFAGVSMVYAEDNAEENAQMDSKGYEDECDHYWVEGGEDYCYCDYCGATKPHNWEVTFYDPGSCTIQSSTEKQCIDCGAYRYDFGNYAPHQWSETLWWDMDDVDYYEYGRYCVNCDEFQYVVKTVKKGKYKRILPKSFLKHAKKKYVFYSKKKVKATKNGKVKGKKRKAVATITWDVQYKNHRGQKWWETYVVKVRVK